MVAARGPDGAFAAYEPCANEHRDHILALTRVPAPGLDAATGAAAIDIARAIAEALDYVGVLAVELFEVEGRRARPASSSTRSHRGCTIPDIGPRKAP